MAHLYKLFLAQDLVKSDEAPLPTAVIQKYIRPPHYSDHVK